MNNNENEKKLFLIAGFIAGGVVGGLLFPAAGLAGLAIIMLSGMIGAIALPIGIGILAGIGYGAYRLYKKATSQCSPVITELNPPLEHATGAKLNANEQNSKLVTLLKSPQTDTSTPLKQAAASNVKQSSTHAKPNMLSRFFSCFSKNHNENPTQPIENTSRKSANNI